MNVDFNQNIYVLTNSATVSTYVTAVPRSLGNKDSKFLANLFASEVREDVVDVNNATWSSSTDWMPPSVATGVFKVDSLSSSICEKTMESYYGSISRILYFIQ